MSDLKPCRKCDETLSAIFTIRTYHECAEVDTIFCACSACNDEEATGSVVVVTKEHKSWGDAAGKVCLATEVGNVLGDGAYYKRGSFGFVREQGKVMVILHFEGREPEVEPIHEGFGRLEMEVLVEQEEEEEN